MEKPDVEAIHGLSPAISIEQKSGMHNPRSTVGTVTEIYDYLRLLYARIGIAYCPEHGERLEAQTPEHIVERILQWPEGSKIMLLAPVIHGQKGEHKQLLAGLLQQGFVRIRVNGDVIDLDMETQLSAQKKNTVEVVVDRLKVRSEQQLRLSESLETVLKLSDGLVIVADMEGTIADQLFSTRLSCSQCDFSAETLHPRHFSFNNPYGACRSCDGLGMLQQFSSASLLVDTQRSIAAGALRGWDKPQSYYYQLLVGLALHDGFSLNTPWDEYSQEIQERILFGTGRQIIPYKKMGLQGRFKITNRRFEGVIPSMQRRYQETESETVRSELSQYLSSQPCHECGGSRLNAMARHVRVGTHRISDLCSVAIDSMQDTIATWSLTTQQQAIAAPILKEIDSRLHFLRNVGLGYLNLARAAETLSGGEAQRIRLASQIGSGLTGVMYILDEPSIGLHQRDNQRLIGTLQHLKNLGNSVIVVEHDEETMLAADHLIDIGPGAGRYGGRVVAQGTPQVVCEHPHSITGQYLSQRCTIPVPQKLKEWDPQHAIRLEKVCTNNLKSVDLLLPLGVVSVISGVSGSGKSSLIMNTLYPAVHNRMPRYDKRLTEGKYQKILGCDLVDQIIKIDQSPIGRTPRSNPATYTGMFGAIRELFAQVPEARSRGYSPGRFSFNVRGGRCESCQGDGVVRVEMHFLADLFVKCERCQGQRYNRDTLQITYKKKNIAEVLQMTIDEALDFFSAVPGILRKCQTLVDVGLGYVQLGQSATTLSGGEAQRLKLSRELSRRDTGRTLYILDEPTTGLHFVDIKQLLKVIFTLRDQGNTVLIIEHNLDVIKSADYLIDVGPEGGDKGGYIVASGTPADISKVDASHTGRFLQRYFDDK